MLLSRPVRRAAVRSVDYSRMSSRTSLSTSLFSRRLHAQCRTQSLPRFHKTHSASFTRRSQPNLFRLNSNNARPSPDVTSNLGSPPNLTLSQRLKAMSKEYGWTALGVYLALSALDFPFCYLAVQLLGPERVGRAEHAIIDFVRSGVQSVAPGLMETQEAAETARRAAAASEKGSKATVWTQLVLAYAVHKSLIFFRVPLTAAVLPKVVKTLRSYGWKVGNKTAKAGPAAAGASVASKS